MKAIRHDGPLAWTEAPTPEPGPGEVRIRVHYTAVNRADLVQRAGLYPPPPGASPILGLECSGLIDAVGEGVEDLQVGHAVCALLAGGGYATHVVVPAPQVLPIPDGLDLQQSAAIVEVFATAWLNLYQLAATQPGERVLVHAGASGVGTAAIQLCKAFGNPCFVTVGSASKIQHAIDLGAEAGFNRHEGRFVDAVKAWGRPDVVLDPVGAAYLADNIDVLSTDGRLVLIGLMGGRKAELDLGKVLIKRLRVLGSTLRARPVAAKGSLLRSMRVHLWPRFTSGQLKPVVDQIIPIEQAEQAHRRLASNETTGKILLSVPI